MNIHPLYSLNISVVFSQREAYILKGEGVGIADKYITKFLIPRLGVGGGGYCCAFYLIFYSYFVNLPYHVLLNK